MFRSPCDLLGYKDNEKEVYEETLKHRDSLSFNNKGLLIAYIIVIISSIFLFFV